RRPLFGRGALALPEALLIAGARRRFVAFSRARDRLRGQVVDLLELVAECLPNTDRFAADARGEMTERIVVQHPAGGQAGAGGDPICHRVGYQLRPALAPEIGGHLGAIRISDQPTDLLGPRRDAPVHLAGAKHGMRRSALAGAAVDQARLGEVDFDVALDAAERLP